PAHGAGRRPAVRAIRPAPWLARLKPSLPARTPSTRSTSGPLHRSIGPLRSLHYCVTCWRSGQLSAIQFARVAADRMRLIALPRQLDLLLPLTCTGARFLTQRVPAVRAADTRSVVLRLPIFHG